MDYQEVSGSKEHIPKNIETTNNTETIINQRLAKD